MQVPDFGAANPWIVPPKKPPGGTSSAAAVAALPSTPTSALTVKPGYTPNYGALIASDPSYLSWKNNATLDVAQAAAARRAALQSLVIRRGGSEGLTDQYGDIDQTTRDLAANNQFSDLANLHRNYTEGLETLKRGLAARGMLQSSDLGYGLDKSAQNEAHSEYDLGNSFSDAANSVIQGYVSSEAAARKAEADALAQAEQNTYNNPAYRPTPAQSANLIPNWQSYGSPIYQDEGGVYYDANGNPIDIRSRLSAVVPSAYSPARRTSPLSVWGSPAAAAAMGALR